MSREAQSLASPLSQSGAATWPAHARDMPTPARAVRDAPQRVPECLCHVETRLCCVYRVRAILCRAISFWKYTELIRILGLPIKRSDSIVHVPLTLRYLITMIVSYKYHMDFVSLMAFDV